MSTRPAGLLKHPDFIKLWTAQTISLFGSHIGGSALRYTAILMLGASPLQISLLAAAGIAPMLLLGLVAGVWVDRLRRRPILIAADLGRALLLLSVPVAYILGVLQIEQLYLVAALTGALTIFFDLAYQAYLPSVVGREQLLEGNSKLGMSDSVAEIAGPPLGGTLVQIMSAPLAVLFDACSFLFSALALWRIRAVESSEGDAEHQEPDALQRVDLWREVSEGLRVVLQEPQLRALLGAAVTSSLAGGIIGGLYDIYFIRELGLTPALVGLTIGIGGVSALAGAFVAQPLAARFGIGPTLIGTLLLTGVASMLLPLASGPLSIVLPMLIVSQLADIGHSVYSIHTLTLRQAITPDRLLGRVNACFNLLPTAALLCGSLAGGLLAESIGARAAIAIAVVGGACASLWLIGSPIRGMNGKVTE